MGKIIKEGVIMLGIFLGIFLSFTLIYQYAKVSKHVPSGTDLEEKLGKVLWESIRQTETILTDEDITSPVDTLVDRICKSNKIARKDIKVHIVDNSQVNAFTFPGNYLVIYSGLIRKVENEAALAGVISHEIAHMQLNHVMKKLAKELGFAALITISSGGSGDVAREAMRILASSAYDREMEKEADRIAVEYMLKAKINPEPFADFMFQLSLNEPEIVKNLAWISTHPETEQRSKDIIEHAKKKKVGYEQVLSLATWEKMKASLKNNKDDDHSGL